MDTSAIVAFLLREPEAKSIADRLEAAEARAISLLSVLESVMVISRSTAQPQTLVEGFLLEAKIESQAFDGAQANWARHAFLTYGKGRHPARLNFGDCISYALAKSLQAPLLFVGNDFSKTDIRAA